MMITRRADLLFQVMVVVVVDLMIVMVELVVTKRVTCNDNDRDDIEISI